MPDPTLLIIAALATLRIALMVATEEGPGGVFTWLRGQVDPDQRTWLGRGINCVWCVSFWAAPLAWALAVWAPVVAMWLALSAATVLAHTWMTRRR